THRGAGSGRAPRERPSEHDAPDGYVSVHAHRDLDDGCVAGGVRAQTVGRSAVDLPGGAGTVEGGTATGDLYDRPHRGGVGVHLGAPVSSESLDDAQAASPESGDRGPGDAGHGAGAPVTYREFHPSGGSRGRAELGPPGDADAVLLGRGQRGGMAQRIADEFTEDEGGVVEALPTEAEPGKIVLEQFACPGDTGGDVGEGDVPLDLVRALPVVG